MSDEAGVQIREAEAEDTAPVVALVRGMAEAYGDSSPISPAFVEQYLAFPGSHILLAEREGRTVGLLSYGVRPELFHAADSCMIEILVVDKEARGQGIGAALIREVVRRGVAEGWAELSISTLPDNETALALYRREGFTDEAILLERHLPEASASV